MRSQLAPADGPPDLHLFAAGPFDGDLLGDDPAAAYAASASAAAAVFRANSAPGGRASPPDFGEQLREGSALVVASSRGLRTR